MSLLWKTAVAQPVEVHHLPTEEGGRIIAQAAGEVRGQIDYYHHSPSQVGIEIITVKRPYRRQGIGTLMMDALRQAHPGKEVVTDDLTGSGDAFDQGYRSRHGVGITALHRGEWF